MKKQYKSVRISKSGRILDRRSSITFKTYFSPDSDSIFWRICDMVITRDFIEINIIIDDINGNIALKTI